MGAKGVSKLGSGGIKLPYRQDVSVSAGHQVLFYTTKGTGWEPFSFRIRVWRKNYSVSDLRNDFDKKHNRYYPITGCDQISYKQKMQ